MSEVMSKEAWRAVEQRDRSQDGLFVYAVSSTGVFCRPSCPSRRPLRANVRFFAAPKDAEAGGYRACRRCHPEELGPDAMARRVEAARRFLDEHADERVTLPRLGKAVGASPFHLQRTFKAITGLTPREYQATKRIGNLKAHLRKGSDVTTAMYEAGYGSGSRLYEESRDRLGMTPGAYKKGGAGVRITYTIVASKLGRLLVGATERGVCAVMMGDGDRSLLATLRAEYPNAEIERDDVALRVWVEAIRDSANGAGHAAVPIDVQGTDFQRQVWEALRRIPAGSTSSYAEVAAALGRPKAVRAVANACASNHVALVVPCHRVVRSDGTSGGYRWGADRKRRLLESEREAARQTA